MGGTMTTVRQEIVFELMKETHFTHAEICDLYRQYKVDSQDNGEFALNRDYFRSLYQKAFPDGDSESLSEIVFHMFDKEKSGQVNFQCFILTLSDPLKGSQQEKNAWLFDLCDGNKDGRISKDEMLRVIQSVNLLNQGFLYATRHVTETQLVDYIFQHCDLGSTGYLSKGDFMEHATKSTTLKYVLEGTMGAILAPYVARKARTGSFGKARSNSVLSVRRPSRSSSLGREIDIDMGEI